MLPGINAIMQGTGGSFPSYVAHQSVTNFTSTTGHSASYTKSAATNCIVALIRTAKTPVASGPTYGGVAMTLAGTLSNTWLVYYINSPLSGSQTLAMTFAATTNWQYDDGLGPASAGALEIIELSENATLATLQTDTATAFSVTVGTSGEFGVCILGASRPATSSPAISGTGFSSISTMTRSESGVADTTIEFGYAPNSGAAVAFSCNAASSNLVGIFCGPA